MRHVDALLERSHCGPQEDEALGGVAPREERPKGQGEGFAVLLTVLRGTGPGQDGGAEARRAADVGGYRGVSRRGGAGGADEADADVGIQAARLPLDLVPLSVAARGTVGEGKGYWIKI